jgi:histidinol-phosphate/aromatic aminotransferase/cobyric acid decarboxylase-like protein/choline kinase
MQAIILAAGMGKRLKELTRNATKCMVEVNGETLIQRALTALDRLSLNRIVLVIGYEGKKLQEYVDGLDIRTPVCYVENSIYDKTNNIYSLYLARDYLLQDDTLLLESDLIFEERVLQRLVQNPYPSLALVAHYESWMDGTVVTLDEEDNITGFIGKKDFDFTKTESYYKTVNIYKFGKEFSTNYYVPFLEAYCRALGHNEYYEQVLKVIAYLDTPVIKAARLEGEVWYEIDDVQDLDIAESLFAQGEDKLKRMQKRYGGYWRYPGLLDYCYLVNPFYPSPKLIAEMKNSFETLLTNYPSGMEVNSLLAAKYFGLKKEQIVIGNGAAELIKAVLEYLPGKMGVILPTFEEYPNRKPEEVVTYVPAMPKESQGLPSDYVYGAEDVIAYFDTHEIQILTLINPDNPSGNYIPRAEVLKIADWAGKKGIILILDESFADFSDCEESTFLQQDILQAYPTMIVVKSISKSFGVPGLRLGVLACGEKEWIARLKKEVAIWNINSFGEFYMQICEKYRKDYENGLKRFQKVRAEFMEELSHIPGLICYPSQANYVLCRIAEGEDGHPSITATELTEKLLDEHRILIKDLSGKKGLEGEYIRLAVRRPEENHCLTEALRALL